VGFGCAEDDRGSLKLGDGKCASDHVEGDAHAEAVTAQFKRTPGWASARSLSGHALD
jgi:hypothetical protein